LEEHRNPILKVKSILEGRGRSLVEVRMARGMGEKGLRSQMVKGWYAVKWTLSLTIIFEIIASGKSEISEGRAGRLSS